MDLSNLTKLQTRTGETDTNLLQDLLDTAEAAILARRFPFGTPGELESKYENLQYRIAIELYNKRNVEGQTAHNSNGINRTYENAWISESLLAEVTPYLSIGSASSS